MMPETLTVEQAQQLAKQINSKNPQGGVDGFGEIVKDAKRRMKIPQQKILKPKVD